MAIVAALLGDVMGKSADTAFYTLQQVLWENRLTANEKLLTKQTKYEEAWEDAYDSAYNCDAGEDKYFKAAGCSFAYSYVSGNETHAKEYAYTKVSQYDEDKLIKLTDLDLEYETMTEMYDTLLATLKAQKESESSALSTNAQDTGMTSGQ